MPAPSIVERKEIEPHMLLGLKRHILRAREKIKQEMEADMAQERKRKEVELRKRREQENTLTLEQTKAETARLEAKLEQLKKDKSDLFSQLKDVIHEEEESRRKNKHKEKEYEMSSLGNYYGNAVAAPAINPTVFLQGSGHMGMYKPHAPAANVSSSSSQPRSHHIPAKRSKNSSPPPEEKSRRPSQQHQQQQQLGGANSSAHPSSSVCSSVSSAVGPQPSSVQYGGQYGQGDSRPSAASTYPLYSQQSKQHTPVMIGQQGSSADRPSANKQSLGHSQRGHGPPSGDRDHMPRGTNQPHHHQTGIPTASYSSVSPHRQK